MDKPIKKQHLGVFGFEEDISDRVYSYILQILVTQEFYNLKRLDVRSKFLFKDENGLIGQHLN